MLRKIATFILLVAAFILLIVLSACGGVETPVAEPTITASATLEQRTKEPEATSPPEAGSDVPVEGEPTEALLDALASRTPEPTVTPGPVDAVVEEVIIKVGLTGFSFLGISATDWVNLAVSIVLILLGYTLGNFLVKILLRWVVRRTQNEFDDAFLETVGDEVRWLVTVLTAQYALLRLTFLGEELLTIISDIIYTVIIVIIARVSIKLIDFAINYYIGQHEDDIEARPGQKTLIQLVSRLGRILVLILFAAILLDHFGINITGVAAALGIAGLAFSLAAQDTIADAISGLIIMLDQPFRVGDRIEIDELGTWGDVVDIGVRTTRIRTRDNRMVIVPNSAISKNQVVNYTYPDPRYRVEVDIGIGYGQDIEYVRQIIHETVRKVPGVLTDKPVDVLYDQMGDSAMTFRVRWWIESYVDTRRIYDRVNTALQNALDEAEVDMPFITYNVNLKTSLQEVGKPTKNQEDDKE